MKLLPLSPLLQFEARQVMLLQQTALLLVFLQALLQLLLVVGG
jgi:hypothetical protein